MGFLEHFLANNSNESLQQRRIIREMPTEHGVHNLLLWLQIGCKAKSLQSVHFHTLAFVQRAVLLVHTLSEFMRLNGGSEEPCIKIWMQAEQDLTKSQTET